MSSIFAAILTLQIFTLPVIPISEGSMYVKVSPAKIFGSKPTDNPLSEINNHIIDGNTVIMCSCDSTLIGTQHWRYYGCYVPYFRLHADIVQDGVAYYMEREAYEADKISLKNLTE